MDEATRRLLENALDAVITIDSQGRVIEWNGQAELTFGWSKAEVANRPLSELIIPERFRENHDRGMKHYLTTGEGPVLERRIEIEGLHKERHELPIELTIHPVEDDAGIRFTAFVRDLTDQRAIEQMKDDLVTTVSHELRTPLTSMQGFVELLLRRELPAAKQREFLEIIDQETQRLTRLVGDFLDVQKLEGGQLKFRMREFDLVELIQEVAEVFATNKTQQRLSLDLEATLPQVTGDSDRIRQALTNLVSNAIKFSPEPGTVLIQTQKVGEAIEISVTDEGIGIAPEDQDRLFEKFFRAEDARLRAIGGSGLGLPLVQQIVEAHAGSITVASELNQGSCFTISLPIVSS